LCEAAIGDAALAVVWYFREVSSEYWFLDLWGIHNINKTSERGEQENSQPLAASREQLLHIAGLAMLESD
jgi:hypothetical protein